MLKNEVGTKWREIRWNDVFQQKIIADKYFMRSGLIRKDLLVLYAAQWMPETHVVSNYQQLAEITEVSKHKYWVLKLCDSSNAYGIHFFCQNDTVQMQQCFDDKQKRVLQQYITPWLTIDQRKFHLRALVLAVGHLDVYVFHDIRVLIATKMYSDTDMDDPFVHITNQSTNKEHGDYNEAEQNVPLSMLNMHGLNVKSVTDQIHCITRGIFLKITASKNRRHFFSLPNCYELFGFDFMIDGLGQVKVLEVNPDPSLHMYHGQAILPFDVSKAVPSDTFKHIFSLDAVEAFSTMRTRSNQSSGKDD
ncbi:hypothetical protein THRCLA_01663 [Thraustotheca clavata]|uniref:Tubulin-tyrosine ligase family n=1 Tax=Thraustotheca clavata TaxID=74557 RepID=A0A1W0A7S6_9STRA|nr:hypothetical protein THRCLA_01663 [Thraustotheca clavata]